MVTEKRALIQSSSHFIRFSFLLFQLRISLFHVSRIENNDETYNRVTIRRNFRAINRAEVSHAYPRVLFEMKNSKTGSSYLVTLLSDGRLAGVAVIFHLCRDGGESLRAIYAASVNYESNFHIRLAVAHMQWELIKSCRRLSLGRAILDCLHWLVPSVRQFFPPAVFSPSTFYVPRELDCSLPAGRRPFICPLLPIRPTGACYVRRHEIVSFYRPQSKPISIMSRLSLFLSLSFSLERHGSRRS